MDARRMFFGLVATSLCAVASAQSDLVAYQPGMLLGRGYDDTTGSIKGDCLDFTRETLPAVGLGSVTYSLTEVTSSQDLLQLTSVDASASVNVGLFSASAEMALLTQSEVNNFNANFLAWVSVERGWDFTKDSALKASFATMATGDLAQFKQNCGNRYVAGILSGGEFYSFINVQTSSQSDRTEVSAALQASYGPFSANGSMSNQTRQSLQSHSTSITGYRTGAAVAPVPLNMDTVQTQAAAFPADVAATGGTPIRVLLVDYPSVPPAILGDILDQLASLRWDYATVSREVTYVLTHPGQFYMTIATWRTFLQQRKTEADAAVNAVGAAMAACSQGGAGCRIPANLRTPDQIRGELPPRYQAQCGSVVFPAWSMGAYPLGYRCGGDTEMAGHHPRTTAEAQVVPASDGRVINVRTHVRMKEDRSDWTCFEQTYERSFSNLAIEHPGCYLRAAADATPAAGTLSATAGEDDHAWHDYPGSGLIDFAHCRSDTGGHDFGVTGCTEVRLKPIHANLTHEEQRMGPNDLKNVAAQAWRNRITALPRVKQISAVASARLGAVLDQAVAKTGVKRTLPQITRPAGSLVVPELRITRPMAPAIVPP